MKKLSVDRYSNINSILHHLDPRIKLIALVFILISILAAPSDSYHIFIGHLIFIGALIYLSKIPVFYIIKRVMIILPFIIFITIFIPMTDHSFADSASQIISNTKLSLLIEIITRSTLSVLSVIIIISSMSMNYLLKALEMFYLPKIIIMILSFMFRYIFVMHEDFLWMQRARLARTINTKKRITITSLANIIARIFIHTYERAEAVYMAMCSRGFTGNIYMTCNFKTGGRDISFITITIFFIIGINIIGR